MPIDRVKIFPSIGIARLGNSPAHFIGPEIPGDQTPPGGGYKDANCRIKRQAARFRLFGYDGTTLVQELTAADADINWTVHVANKKASWHLFSSPPLNPDLRNAFVADRASLEIDPGPRTLNAPNQVADFDTGSFLGLPVSLGGARTDGDGRLLVLGGFGRSGSVPPGEPINNFANNDRWFDDVCDGPVRASVSIGGGPPIDAEPAWVVCGPPDFAPTVDNIVSLYDLLFQVAVDRGLEVVPAVSSYTQDIWPMLERVFEHSRVSSSADGFHTDFHSAGAAAMSTARRQAVFNKLENPDGSNQTPEGDPDGNMPTLAQVRVTPVQYTHMHRWAFGVEGTDWDNDWPGAPPPLPPNIDPTQPEEITRAALQVCVGAAMFPGIEASWLLRDSYAFTEPFRLDASALAAGDLTKQMAVPWQADFDACSGSWWPAARPGWVYPAGGGPSQDWTRDIINTPYLDMVAHWHKLGFVTDQGGSLVETERHVVCRTLNLITDRSHFSQDEVDAVLTTGSPAAFQDSFYVIAEGFTPAELGVTGASPTQAQLVSFAPAIAIRRADNTVVPGMTARPHAFLLQDNSLPADLRQRFTFVYQIEFDSTAGFSVGGAVVESQTVNLTATKNAGGAGTHLAYGFMHLVNQPNPYMLDGPTHWLSTDVRVFQIQQGQSRFGQNIGSTGASAITFLQNVLSDFNAHAPAGHPFDLISTDQQDSRLELSRSVDGQRVFNFAIAKVRYIGNVLSAEDVRVFFRMFTTAATGLNYAETTTYRRSEATAPISLLGLQGGRIVTIPFFAEARVDSSSSSIDTQTDATNVRTLIPAGGAEQHGYFGCWLDFNQTTPQFPLDPAPRDGPWAAGRLSIQELIRGMHQCLVAEVHFQPDPIAPGATPSANDNLSQRNLAISESDNPGGPATHTVQHTFEIKASYPSPQLDAIAMPLMQAAAPVDDVMAVAVGDNAALVAQQQIRLPAGPDELMIRWNNLPDGSEMLLYMSDVDVDEILSYAGQNYELPNLERVDAHTIRCLPGDVTYVPLPMGRSRNIAALLTIVLPESVRRKQVFDVTVHQLSGRPRVVLGAFQLTIPVSDKAALRAVEVRKLSVLRHIARAIPQDDQWWSVFDRYVRQIADRVEGFGSDPDVVEPSADGTGADPATMSRKRFQSVYALLIMLAVIASSIVAPVAPIVAGACLLAAILVVFLWRSRALFTRCLWLVATVFGVGVGAAVVAVLLAIGFAGRGVPVLSATAIIIGILLLLGARWRCFFHARN